MNWGEFIEKKRKEQGLSVADLSLKSSVKGATIYTIEKGQKNGGNIENVSKILTALGCRLVVQDENGKPVQNVK